MANGPEMEDSLKKGVEHLKTIFDLCDQDNDGCISADDFKSIGLEHFGDTQEVEMLISEMDPDQTLHISFSMFCRGIETYLITHRQLPGSGSLCSLSSCHEDRTVEASSPGGSDSAFSSEEVYPVDHRFSNYLSIGYNHSIPSEAVIEELIGDPDEPDSAPLLRKASNGSSTPNGFTGSNGYVGVTRDSPSLAGRRLLHRHKLLLSGESPSQSSTPAELADQEVSKLSDQLCELSTRLEDLREDHRDSEGSRNRLKLENNDLKMRLEEYESQLRETEETTQKKLNESQSFLNSSLVKVRFESEKQVMDLQFQLESTNKVLHKTQDTVHNLQSQLALTQEELLAREGDVGELEDDRRTVEEELQRTREQLRQEREAWGLEREAIKQDVLDHECHVTQLQEECEEAHHEAQRHAITAADMSREIETLKKELDKAQLEKEEMQSNFLLKGKELIARNKESLAAEMDNASRDEVLKALKNSEDMNQRLQSYIDGLLTNIIDKHPELLEIH